MYTQTYKYTNIIRIHRSMGMYTFKYTSLLSISIRLWRFKHPLCDVPHYPTVLWWPGRRTTISTTNSSKWRYAPQLGPDPTSLVVSLFLYYSSLINSAMNTYLRTGCRLPSSWIITLLCIISKTKHNKPWVT